MDSATLSSSNKFGLTTEGKDEATKLLAHVAVRRGMHNVLRLLLDVGSNIVYKDGWGYSPLCLAQWGIPAGRPISHPV